MSDEVNDLNDAAEEAAKKLLDLARTGNLTSDDLKKLGIQVKKNAVGAEEWGKVLKSTTSGLNSMISAASQSNASFGAATTAVDAVANVMSDLASNIPFVGGAIKGLAQVTNFAIKRIEASYDAFKQVGEAGMLGAEGLDGLRAQMLESRIPMERLAKMMTKNSEALTYFTGTAQKGGKAFTEVMGSMQKGEDKRLRYLGFSLEEIGDTVVNFQKRSKRLGYEQETDTLKLRNATAKYGAELDMIAKLTGKQRSKIEQERDTLMADDQFRAMMNELPNVGEAAKTKMMDSLNQLPPGIATGVKQIMASGAIIGEEAKQLGIQGMGADILKLRERFRSGQIDVSGFMDALRKSAETHKMTFNQLTAITGQQIGARISELSDLAKKKTITKEQQVELDKLQWKQMVGGGELTRTTVDASIAMENSQTKLDALATSGGFAATAITSFTKVLDYGTEKLMDLLGTDKEGMKNKTEEKFKNLENLNLDKLGDLSVELGNTLDNKQALLTSKEHRGELAPELEKEIAVIKEQRKVVAEQKALLVANVNGEADLNKSQDELIKKKQVEREKEAEARERDKAFTGGKGTSNYIRKARSNTANESLLAAREDTGVAEGDVTIAKNIFNEKSDVTDFANIKTQSSNYKLPKEKKDLQNDLIAAKKQLEDYKAASLKDDNVISAHEQATMQVLASMMEKIGSELGRLNDTSKESRDLARITADGIISGR